MQTEKMLSAWMLWFQRRHKQYEDWAEDGEPKVMWLSGIQIPETYIAALVQTACRDKGWPLDRSTTYTQVKISRLFAVRKKENSDVATRVNLWCYFISCMLGGRVLFDYSP